MLASYKKAMTPKFFVSAS